MTQTTRSMHKIGHAPRVLSCKEELVLRQPCVMRFLIRLMVLLAAPLLPAGLRAARWSTTGALSPPAPALYNGHTMDFRAPTSALSVCELQDMTQFNPIVREQGWRLTAGRVLPIQRVTTPFVGRQVRLKTPAG